MCIIQSTTIIEKSKQYSNILKVYKRIKEVGELTLGDLTVTPSPHPQVAKSLYLFSSSNAPPHCGEERCVMTLTTAV